jgi:hypothetical protein
MGSFPEPQTCRGFITRSFLGLVLVPRGACSFVIIIADPADGVARIPRERDASGLPASILWNNGCERSDERSMIVGRHARTLTSGPFEPTLATFLI